MVMASKEASPGRQSFWVGGGYWPLLVLRSTHHSTPFELEGESHDHRALAVGDQLLDVTLRPRRRPEERITHRLE